MGNVLNLISPIPVSVNHYIKPRVFMVKGKPMVSLYETSEAKEYKKKFKKYIEKQIVEQGYSLTPTKTQHFYIDCVFYFERIDKDPNNYFKLLLDAVTETQMVWIDDNVTCERVNAIYYDPKNPRIELTIRPVEYVGIFETQDDKTGFEDKCKTCSRYARNCSILKKAIEGRIQEEITDKACSKYKEAKTAK